MNNRRRRANDFTNSLHNFHQTFDGNCSLTVSQTYSEDSLDTNSTRDKQHRNDNLRNNEPSVILAGNFASEQFVSSSSDSYHTAEDSSHIGYRQFPSKNTLDISDAKSHLPTKPNLNKCINLFLNEHLEKGDNTWMECSSISSTLCRITNKLNENIDPCHLNKDKTEIQYNLNAIRPRVRAVSSSSLRHINVPEEGIKKSKSCTMLNNFKRDTNYNIKPSKFFLAPTKATTQATKYEKVDPIAPLFDTLTLSKSSASSNKKDDLYSTEEEKYDSTNNESNEFNPAEQNVRTLLYLLRDQQKPEETATQENLFRRMSQRFNNSPVIFTEKLLTIIEESVLNDSSTKFTDISLRRLTAEIRKRCKWLDDETAPEWPLSPGMSTSIRTKEENRESKKREFDASRKSLDTFSSPNKDSALPVTPRRNVKNSKKIYRHTPKDMLGVLDAKSSICENIAHDSTRAFEYLEEFCEGLCPNQATLPMQKSQLQSPLWNMKSILRACDDQMASLENTPNNVCEQPKNTITSTFDSTNQHDAVPETQNFRYKLLVHENCNNVTSNNTSVVSKEHAECSKHYEMIAPDNLENTLICEIAKKRQRCLDTVKVMMEIDANSEVAGAQQTCSNIAEVSSSTSDDAKFKGVLMFCKNYQNYLEEILEGTQTFNLLQTETCRSRSPCDKKDIRAKEANKARVATLRAPGSSATRKKSPSPMRHRSASNKSVVSKPRLFVTPGKTPTNKIAFKEKRPYFPNFVVPNLIDPNKQKGSNISPHAKSIYRHMGMNYDSVKSPVAMYIKGTDPPLMKNLRPKTDKMLLTPRRKQTAPSVTPKSEMKFKLSPKRPKKMLTETAARNENIPDNFSHPKVQYKLPSHIRTIKEAENKKVGNRMNELLRSTQDKVVIRHEGRMKKVQTNNLELPEIHYDSAEESVHIEQIARKTCFSRMQKDS